MTRLGGVVRLGIAAASVTGLAAATAPLAAAGDQPLTPEALSARGAGARIAASPGPAYTDQAVAHTPGGMVAPGVNAPQAQTWDTGFSGAGEPNVGIATDSMSSAGYDVFADAFTSVAKSGDAGATWTDVTPTLPGGAPAHPTSLDPYLRVDASTNRLFKVDLVSTCELFSYSDDRGTSWTNYTTACNLSDHETIAAGPPVTSPTVGYPDIVYDCSQSGGYNGASTASICDKSLDGGVTFVATGTPAFNDPSPYGFGPGSGDSGIPGHCLGDIGPIFV
ncbi:MAG: sialidase family protein, partial [Candidatus Dormibacteria bacterium]